jgi:predicted PhzF superfamily epimerase YddE/YHI9
MLPLSIVDAFTAIPFAGNPAAVCRLDAWPGDGWFSTSPPR